MLSSAEKCSPGYNRETREVVGEGRQEGPSITRKFIAAVFADPEDGGYVATVPGVPGVVGQGETEEEAYEDVTKALEFHLESMAEFGEEIPEEPTPTSTRTIELTV